MAIKLEIPTALRPYAGKQASLELAAATVGEALKQVTGTYAQLGKHLYAEDGRIRSFVNIYVNDEDIRYLQKENTPIKDGDTISIVPSIAGGRSSRQTIPEEPRRQTLEFLGRTFALDKDGHLAQPGEWSRAIAREIASKEGIDELTEQHWRVIDFMRKVYDREGASPSIRRITKESGVDTKSLYQLFPEGPGKKAAKIAGLPKPKSCV